MFHPVMTALTALLFVVLTPGILVTIPAKGSKIIVALTHGIIFALVYYLLHKSLLHVTKKFEGFQSQYVFPPAIANGQMCEAQTCMCNGAEIAEKGRCQ
jgi:hypothetical protein